MSKTFIEIETDYFGGFGKQLAKIYSNRNFIFVLDENPINKALQYLDVKAEKGYDEFDTLGLGKFRTNDDIL